MRDRKHLQHGINLAIDDSEWKSPQGDLSQVWRAYDFETPRGATCPCNGPQHRQVVPPPKAVMALFVVDDLLLVLKCGIWMETVIHFSRA
jgi:hypothetical protein